MLRRIATVVLLAALVFAVACTNKKVNNPLANVGSKQPDKVLFDRAMDAMKHNRFDVSRMTMQTLINTYPDSEYIARAKLAVADSWYAEGGTASLTQAEIEYKDFETFFPNMPEAAEAQLKIANIHYQEMEKPDRDFTHARRAEDEYRQLILQCPDSKLVPDAKQHLMQVQEVIAEREFGIGHFYYLRLSYPAAIARLRSVIDRYPLYSGADDALFTLGQPTKAKLQCCRSPNGRDCQRPSHRSVQERSGRRVCAVITRYPLQDHADVAKERLEALGIPVPRPTRRLLHRTKRKLKVAKKRHDVVHDGHLPQASGRRPGDRVGEPTLVDPKQTSAMDVVQAATKTLSGNSVGGNNAVSIEAEKDAPPRASPPRAPTLPLPRHRQRLPISPQQPPNRRRTSRNRHQTN